MKISYILCILNSRTRQENNIYTCTFLHRSKIKMELNCKRLCFPNVRIEYTLFDPDIGPNLLLYQTSSRGFCTRRLVEIFYQTSSSRKIATYQASFRRSKYLLDVQQQKNSSTRRLVEFLFDAQQNFYQTSSRPDDLGQWLFSSIFMNL